MLKLVKSILESLKVISWNVVRGKVALLRLLLKLKIMITLSFLLSTKLIERDKETPPELAFILIQLLVAL